MRRALLALVFWLALAAGARANGRMPGANDVVFRADDPAALVARGTFGLVRSDDGQSWQWICEQAIDTSGVIADPPLAFTADGLVLLPPTGGVLVSRDRGCTWSRADGPLNAQRGVDLTHDPSAPARLLLLGSTLTTVAQGFGSYANVIVETADAGASFRLLAELASDFEAETLEVAASDAQRIYVSGTLSNNPRVGVLERSEDGGLTWTRSLLDLPAGSGSMFVSAIHPADPDTLWVRVPARGDTLGILPARLYLSVDKGQTFRMLADTKRGMFGFALSPDGSQLAYGGPADGLFVGPSDGSAPYEKKSSLGVRCLRWPREDTLYACGSEPQDPFSLGVSRDHGESFAPLYRMVDTCPAECGDTTTFAALCQTAWGSIGPFIAASADSCSVPWAQAALLDAGTRDAGADVREAGSDVDAAAEESDASPAAPVRRGSSGCALAPAPSRSPARWWMALAALVFLRRRRRAR